MQNYMMHLKFNKMVTFWDSNSKLAKNINDFNSNVAKIADLQAQNASHCDAF